MSAPTDGSPGRPLNRQEEERTSTPTGPGGEAPRHELDAWWTVLKATVGLGFDLAFRLRFSGLENVPQRGGAILAYNHISVLDPVVVAMGAAKRGRAVRFLGLSEVFDQRLIGWGLRRARQIPLRRGLGDREALSTIADIVRGGSLAGIAPEGMVGDGDALQTGQKGVARIALAAGAPVIPVGIWGTHLRWPKDGLKWTPPLRPAVALDYAPAVMHQGNPANRSDVRAMTDRIMGALEDAVASARARAGGRSPASESRAV
jgi:1-acyl-sn-glycerol-3-phosphate acyltransferase